MDEFVELLNFVPTKIAEHPEFGSGFDLKLANWLDSSGKLFNIYKRWKDNPMQGMRLDAELQSRTLLELWKQQVGSDKATFEEFKNAIVNKPLTNEIIQATEEHICKIRLTYVNTNNTQHSGSIIIYFLSTNMY